MSSSNGSAHTIARISAAGAANIHRPAAKPSSACTYPVVSIRLVRNTRQVTRVLGRVDGFNPESCCRDR